MVRSTAECKVKSSWEVTHEEGTYTRCEVAIHEEVNGRIHRHEDKGRARTRHIQLPRPYER